MNNGTTMNAPQTAVDLRAFANSVFTTLDNRVVCIGPADEQEIDALDDSDSANLKRLLKNQGVIHAAQHDVGQLALILLKQGLCFQ